MQPLPFRYSVKIGSSTSIMGPSIPARTREVLVSHLASYNMWALQGTWCFLSAREDGLGVEGCHANLSPGPRASSFTPFLGDVALPSSGISIQVSLAWLGSRGGVLVLMGRGPPQAGAEQGSPRESRALLEKCGEGSVPRLATALCGMGAPGPDLAVSLQGLSLW